MGLLGLLKERKKEELVDFGKPIENISIKIASLGINKNSKLQMLAKRNAKKLIAGSWHSTDKKFFIKGHKKTRSRKKEIPQRKATLDISDNISDLVALGRVGQKVFNKKYQFRDIHFHYDGGGMARIKLYKIGIFILS